MRSLVFHVKFRTLPLSERCPVNITIYFIISLGLTNRITHRLIVFVLIDTSPSLVRTTARISIRPIRPSKNRKNDATSNKNKKFCTSNISSPLLKEPFKKGISS
jgi:hypothetical protein